MHTLAGGKPAAPTMAVTTAAMIIALGDSAVFNKLVPAAVEMMVREANLCTCNKRVGMGIRTEDTGFAVPSASPVTRRVMLRTPLVVITSSGIM